MTLYSIGITERKIDLQIKAFRAVCFFKKVIHKSTSV